MVVLAPAVEAPAPAANPPARPAAPAPSCRPVDVTGIDPGSALPPGMGPSDPTARRAPGLFARAVHTPAGPGTILIRWAAGRADVQAWGGDGAAEWLLDAAPAWLGVHDDVSGFRPGDPLVAAVWERLRDHRIGAGGLIWDELLAAIVSQRVQFVDAARSWRRLVRAWGTPAPGPAELGLLLPPPADALAVRTYADLHRFDLERRRADAILRAGRHGARLAEAAGMDPQAAVARIRAVPGLGPWTATTVVAASHGDPDTVVLGDFWMPTIVRHALTGDRRWCDDDGAMLDLLAPFAGHRGRVVRLLAAAGFLPSRRAPRRERHRIAHL